jgi:hypothetical protein|nr:hypothetical protein [Kofleriaceae bacterium]
MTALATGDVDALDALAATAPRVSLAIHIRGDGAQLWLSADAGPSTPAQRLSAVAPAAVVQRVLAWAIRHAASVMVALDRSISAPDFGDRARAVLDTLGATPTRVVVIPGDPQSERGEPAEYGQPGVALELATAGGHPLTATLVQGVVPADDCPAVTADYARRAQALADALGVTCQR